MMRVRPELSPAAVHLAPGHLVITAEPRLITTVLGSCVAVTMYDPQTRLAGICHAMLARPQPHTGDGLTGQGRYRYASHAVPALIAAFRRRGVPLGRIEVKLFGGGNVIPSNATPASLSIGSANVAVARSLLAAAELDLAAESTGGTAGRKLVFNTANGEVLIKHLPQGIA